MYLLEEVLDDDVLGVQDGLGVRVLAPRHGERRGVVQGAEHRRRYNVVRCTQPHTHTQYHPSEVYDGRNANRFAVAPANVNAAPYFSAA